MFPALCTTISFLYTYQLEVDVGRAPLRPPQDQHYLEGFVNLNEPDVTKNERVIDQMSGDAQ